MTHISIEQHINNMKNCPKEMIIDPNRNNNYSKIPRIKCDYGIYENFILLLDTSNQKILEYLEGNKNYSMTHRSNRGGIANITYEHLPSNSSIQVFKTKERDFITPYNYSNPEEQQKQLNDYESTILFHRSTKKDLDLLKSVHKILEPLEDICNNYVSPNDISICIPCSNNKKGMNKSLYFP